MHIHTENQLVTLLGRPMGFLAFKQTGTDITTVNEHNLPLDIFAKDMVIHQTAEMAQKYGVAIYGDATKNTEVYLFMLLTSLFMGYQVEIPNEAYQQLREYLKTDLLIKSLGMGQVQLPEANDGPTQRFRLQFSILTRARFGTKLARFAKKAARRICTT